MCCCGLKTPWRLDSTDHVQLHTHRATMDLFVESVVTCSPLSAAVVNDEVTGPLSQLCTVRAFSMTLTDQ